MRDRALVEQYQAGDAAAFEDLYRRYYARLFRFCLKRVGDRHEAEELTQEAFARAYGAMPSLRGERRFYPWLSVIASRLCVDTHRRLGRTEPAAEVDTGAVDGGCEVGIEADDERDLLVQALRRLNPRHREVLELREQRGWSYQRIADHYGITLGAVEGLLFRARQALRREFISVAGPDAGLAAGVPALGWLLRRLNAARFRCSSMASTLTNLPALTANMVGLAMVVTTAAGLYTAVVPASRPTSVVRLAAAGPSAATSADPGAGLALAAAPATPVVGHAAPAAATSSHTGRAPQAPPPGSAGRPPAVPEVPIPGASYPGAGAAHDRAAGNPVALGQNGLAVGTDPTRVTADTVTLAESRVTKANQAKGVLP